MSDISIQLRRQLPANAEPPRPCDALFRQTNGNYWQLDAASVDFGDVANAVAAGVTMTETPAVIHTRLRGDQQQALMGLRAFYDICRSLGATHEELLAVLGEPRRPKAVK